MVVCQFLFQFRGHTKVHYLVPKRRSSIKIPQSLLAQGFPPTTVKNEQRQDIFPS
jgi:hypothetical protein